MDIHVKSVIMGIHFKVTSRFHYSKLKQNEKRIYEKVAAAWLNYSDSVVLLSAFQCDFQKVFDALNYDYPELFYVDFSNIVITQFAGSAHVRTSFLYSKAECERLKCQINDKISTILSNIDKKNPERCIHDFLAENVSYAYNTLDASVHSIKATILDGSAVCEGYAKTFKLLCDVVNIPCMVVGGTAFSPTNSVERHSWNIVHLKTGNYNVDVTWDSCIGNSLHPYYNASDNLFSIDHRWDRNYYPRCNLINSFEEKIIEIADEKTLNQILKKFCLAPSSKLIIRPLYAVDQRKNLLQIITNKINSIKCSSSIQTLLIPGMMCVVLIPVL